MHPSSPEEYFLLDMCGADEMDILQQNSGREQEDMDAEHQHVATEAPAEAKEAVTDTEPAETKPAFEAGSGQAKVEAGSNAFVQAPLKKAEASEGVPPVEAALKEEPCESEPTAAADEPMPGPSPENHRDAADTAVRVSPEKDEQGQPSAVQSLPSTNANVTERQEALPESEAAQPSPAADAGPSTESVPAESGTAAAGEAQPQEQPEAKVEIAPILTASKQPRLPNGRFLPKGKQRPESAPAAWTRDSGSPGPSVGTTAAVHADGASGPLGPGEAGQEALPSTEQQIPVPQKSREGRKRHSMPALACQLPSRRSMRGVKAQHGETHSLQDQNGTELASKAHSAAPVPVVPVGLAPDEDAQPASGTSADAQPDTGSCPDPGPSRAHSELPLENGVQQLRCVSATRSGVTVILALHIC